jgi:hypothetical protein
MKLSDETANLEFDTLPQTIVAGTTVPLQISQQVNWRTVLGDMYNKYDKFLMVFNSFGGFSGSSSMNYNGGGNNLVWTIGITSDISFLSNTVNGQLSSIAYFPTRFTLPINGFGLTNSSTTTGVVFQKPQNATSRLTIALYQIRGGAPCVIGTTVNTTYDYNFSFTIFGLSDE